MTTMRKVFYSIGILALAALSFASCQKQPVPENESGKMVTVTFVAEAPATKSAAVEGSDSEGVSYKWTQQDADNMKLFTVDGTSLTEVSNPVVTIVSDTKLTITADVPADSKVRAIMAGEWDGNTPVVLSSQNPSAENYDPNADILVSDDETISGDAATQGLIFRRQVVINKMTLHYLAENEKVKQVIITSNKELTGAGNTLTLNYTNATANADGQFPVYFVTKPNSDQRLTVKVKTENLVYTKTLTADVSLISGKFTRFGVALQKPKYVKVTSTSDLAEGGKYLIVYEDGSLAFDGGLETLDAVGNTISVTINDGSIESTAQTDAAAFVISSGTIYSQSGYYIGQTSNANGLAASEENAYANTISFDNDGNANIVSGEAYLRYNSTSNQTRFRYYKSSSYTNQKAISLYLLEGSGGPDERTSVSLGFNPATPDAITLGDDFTEPTLSKDPTDAPVAYSVVTEPEGIATINSTTGDLSITAAGTITVTASVSDETNYKPASASYTLTVNAPAGHGESADDPFTVAEVITFVNGLGESIPTDDEYYVSGIISSIANNGKYAESGSYGNATFYISDDGKTTTQFEAFRILYLGNIKWTSGNPDISVGDEVVICGRLTKYNNQVETLAATGDNAYNGYLYSLEKAPYFTARVTSNNIEYTGGNSITLNIGANVNWTASIDNGASLKIGDANAAASVSGNSDTAVSVIIPENTAGQTYTISFSTTSQEVSAPADIQIIQTKQETLLSMTFAAETDITADNYGTLTYNRPISIQFAKGSGTSYGYYSPIRFYANNTLTISSPFSNVVIKKVEFTVTQAGAMTANQGVYSNGTWLGETSSLELTCTSQTRFSDFTVYYSVDGDLPTLSSITIDDEPTKTTYTVGQAFDFAGASVTAHYSDNTSTLDVTSMVTTNGSAVVGTEGTGKTVTVSYTEAGVTKTDTFTIDVNAATSGSTTVSMSTFSAVSGNVDGDTNVSYAASQGTSATQPAINSGVIRIYQNGGLLTITANNSKKISAITIGSSMETTVTTKVDGGTESSDNSISAGGTYTIDNLNATTVVFKCTGSDKSHRLYLNSLSVTYK